MGVSSKIRNGTAWSMKSLAIEFNKLDNVLNPNLADFKPPSAAFLPSRFNIGCVNDLTEFLIFMTILRNYMQMSSRWQFLIIWSLWWNGKPYIMSSSIQLLATSAYQPYVERMFLRLVVEWSQEQN
jgi:hypothetical protein